MWIVQLTLFLFLSSFLVIVQSDEHDHEYKDGEEVVLWMNTVGPYHNRQETYPYFSLPYVPGPKKEIDHYHETLAEALQGVEMQYSGLEMYFKKDIKSTEFGEIMLDREKLQMFVYAISNYYWYQMYIDDLPLWGIVGEQEGSDEAASYHLWTHKKFEIGYNGDRIVEVNLTSANKVKLEPDIKVPFSYEIIWRPSTILFDNRFDRYLDSGFFEHKIHWFSIFNSFMMVIFLVGLVSMILMKTLRKDYARYDKDDDVDSLEKDIGDEYGWKQVHGDVFRTPVSTLLLSSFVGNGVQTCLVSILACILAAIGHVYMERGSLLNTIIVIFAVTSPVNGYFGGSLFSKFGGRRWISQTVFGSIFLPALISICAFFVNLIALYYQSARVIPFLTMLAIVSIVCFVVVPLNLLGTLLGRNLSGKPNYPCRVNAVPRPIPEKKWFMEPSSIVLLGGLLPFGSIFIEMYFIFTSFWAYKIYFVYGFTLLVILILLVVTSCVSMVSTYFLLNSEDYRWQWTSFGCGISTAVYVYMYAVYYFFFKTKMYGLFQTCFYFSYMAVFCVVIGIMCGTVGFICSSRFVKKIYSYIKID